MNKRLITCGRLFRLCGLHWCARMLQSASNVRVTYTHGVLRGDLENFERNVRYLQEVRRVISPQEFLALYSNGHPFEGRLLLMTFDDGLLSSYDATRQVLDRYGIKAVFFVPTGILDLKSEAEMRRFALESGCHETAAEVPLEPEQFRVMTAEHLAALAADGHMICPHTHSHLSLRDIRDRETAERELVRPRAILQDLLHREIRTFAFPVGTERQMAPYAHACIRDHYDFCFTALNGVNTARSDPHLLHRDCLPADAPPAYVRLVMSGAYDCYYLLKMSRMRREARVPQGGGGFRPISQPPPAPRFAVGHARVSAVTMADALGLLDALARTGRRGYVCAANVRTAVRAQKDAEFRAISNDSDLTIPDGMPLVWYARLAGVRNVERVSGPDLMTEVLARSAERGYTHYFYGDTPETLGRVAKVMAERYPGAAVRGLHSPPFRPLTDDEVEATVGEINRLRPTFVWVGLGAPKQERWMARVIGRIDASILVGVGAALRFLVGDYRHPPRIVQRMGLEGVCWRFLRHPVREGLWYAYHVPAFGALLCRMLARRVVGKS